MSFKLQRRDESGIWAEGPYRTLDDARKGALGIIKVRTQRAGEKWTKLRELEHGVHAAWQNTKGDILQVVSV